MSAAFKRGASTASVALPCALRAFAVRLFPRCTAGKNDGTAAAYSIRCARLSMRPEGVITT